MSPRRFPAGWYPDPSRAGYQRYWDGTAWTHQAAPLGPTLPRAPGRGRRIAIGVLLTAVLAGGVAIAVPLLDDNPSARNATTQAGNLDIARRVSVAPTDLPGGWTECCPPTTFPPSDLRQHICGSGSDLPAHLAGYERQYALNLRPDFSEDGHLISDVVIASDSTAAAREFASVDVPLYRYCGTQSVEQEALVGAQSVVGRPSTTGTRDPFDVGVPTILDRYVTTFKTRTGSGTVFTALFRLVVGRVLVRVDILTYSAPISDSTISDLACAVKAAARCVNSSCRHDRRTRPRHPPRHHRCRRTRPRRPPRDHRYRRTPCDSTTTFTDTRSGRHRRGTSRPSARAPTTRIGRSAARTLSSRTW